MDKNNLGTFRYRDHSFWGRVVIDKWSAKIVLHELSNNYYDVETDEFDVSELADEYFAEDKLDELTEHFFLVDRKKE